ncbi:MAG: sigma factor [Planctomycetota bacterium]
MKHPDLAEDATQETFLRIIRRLPRVQADQKKFDTWVLCIARNVAISFWRKRQAREEISSENAAKLDEPVAEDVDILHAAEISAFC